MNAIDFPTNTYDTTNGHGYLLFGREVLLDEHVSGFNWS